MTTTLPATAGNPPRLAGVDRLRGLAVAAMVVDHVALFAGVELLRLTVGRVAVPLFFLVAGALVSRVSWRWAVIALAGFLLPQLAPWVDSPNVLVLYFAGAVVVVVSRWLSVAASTNYLVGVLLVCLALLANGWTITGPGAYPVPVLVALMALGQLLGKRYVHSLGVNLPGWLAGVGRFPLSVYVGHVLLLTVLAGIFDWL